MQIIDPHHHLWDLERHDYPWLRPETRHPAGDLTPICQSYRLDDFLFDAAGLDLVKSVHLQAEIDRRDTVAETAWLQALADAPESRGFPHGIVAFADLADPQVEATLERVARLSGQYDRAVITIVGHTDGSMRGKVPQQAVATLSRERANAVKQALVAKYKFDPNKFTVEGKGWDQPADPAAPENHAMNRRVEVSVYPVESGG